MGTNINDSSFLNLDFSDSTTKEAAERWTTEDLQSELFTCLFKIITTSLSKDWGNMSLNKGLSTIH